MMNEKKLNKNSVQKQSVSTTRASLLLKGLGLVFLGILGFAGTLVIQITIKNYQTDLLIPVQYPAKTAKKIATTSAEIQDQQIQSPVLVYGFLPYWTIKTAQIPPQLTHIGYFSLTIDKNGNFITATNDGTDMGWYRYHSSYVDNLKKQTHAQQQKLEILITMMDADEIALFLTNPLAQERFLKNIRQFVKTQPIDGINLDIEYAGDVTAQLRTNMTEFVKDISLVLDSIDPSFHLSIDVFADSAVKERIWDIPAVAEYTDHIIVMAYDFFRSSSAQSGPVSPIFGSENNRWETDIMKNLRAFIEKVPSEKIILGIPFYGYEWQTTSEEPGAATYPKSGGLATYKRVQELIHTMGLEEHWDNDALSPYVVYKEKGRTQTIFYENSRSLSYKLDLVNQAELGGIAIWALGYEGNHEELWEVIQQKLQETSSND